MTDDEVPAWLSEAERSGWPWPLGPVLRSLAETRKALASVVVFHQRNVDARDYDPQCGLCGSSPDSDPRLAHTDECFMATMPRPK